MRARLGQCRDSLSFQVTCDVDMVGHISRVVTWAGGVVADRVETDGGTIMHIKKNITRELL